MPYIKEREQIDAAIAELSPLISNVGDLNYAVTRLTLRLLLAKGLNYDNINNTFGTLSLALMEMYRRIAVEYEDVKMRQNGDVPEIIEISNLIRAMSQKLPAEHVPDTLQAHG